MEDKLDGVEKGDTDYRQVLRAFYDGFMDELSNAEKAMEKQAKKNEIKNQSDEIKIQRNETKK